MIGIYGRHLVSLNYVFFFLSLCLPVVIVSGGTNFVVWVATDCPEGKHHMLNYSKFLLPDAVSRTVRRGKSPNF